MGDERERMAQDIESYRRERKKLQAENAQLRALLGELYDGDACDCNAQPGEQHEAECFQTRVEAAL